MTGPEERLTLPGSESLLWEGRPSLWSFAGWFFLCALLTFAFGAGLLLLAGLLLFRHSRRYAVTTRRVLATTGLLHPRTVEIELMKVEGAECAPALLPVAPGIGDLIVRGGGTVLRMDSIYPCEEIRKLILSRRGAPEDQTPVPSNEGMKADSAESSS